jgi:hypothetical protein
LYEEDGCSEKKKSREFYTHLYMLEVELELDTLLNLSSRYSQDPSSFSWAVSG